MKSALQKYLRENILFLSGTLLFVFIMGLFYFENGKIEAHLMLNASHEYWADVVLSYFTHTGGAIPCLFAAGLMVFRFRSGLYILISQGVAALITQPLKYLHAHPRPLSHWTDWDQSAFASNLDLYDRFNAYMTWWTDTAASIGYQIPGGYNSFPSGHTSAAFAFMACLAALLPPKHKGWQIAFLIIGIGVAYSRIYLSCHFLEDTLLGALIGTIAAAITYCFMYKSEWGDRPIYKLKQR